MTTTCPPRDVVRYIETHRCDVREEKEGQFRGILRYVQRVRPITADLRMLELGTGAGWFVTLCAAHNLQCEGLELSRELIDLAYDRAAQMNVSIRIHQGDIETTPLGQEEFDVVFASSVFEHVQNWRPALRRAYEALRPGGVLFFESTNKFSLRSGEWEAFRFYGWLPDRLRYTMRKVVHGSDIMQYGIDFHQFTHRGLRRAFREIGFQRVLDRVELADPDWVQAGSKRGVLRLAKRSRLVKAITLTFVDATTFVCVK